MENFGRKPTKQNQELIDENNKLQTELRECEKIIEALKRENLALIKRMNSYTLVSNESEPVIEEIEINSEVCKNCDQEVPKNNLEVHESQCMRRIRKCKACNIAINISE